MRKDNYYGLIMAGGVGTRFWPLSTEKKPKQFQDILGEGASMFQKTFERLSPLIAPSKVFIATNKRYEKTIEEQLPQLESRQIFCEPTMQNTAPCILASTLKIHKQNPEAIIVVAPSDHWIENNALFLENIGSAFDHCRKCEDLITLGINPNHPNTGYGYIAYDSKHKTNIKPVQKFTEKPDEATAIKFLNSGKHLWNAGIFIWRASAIIKAFEKYMPDMYAILNAGKNDWNTEKEKTFLDTNYPLCENISIDFGILEKAKNVVVLPCHFNWSDLGTWGSLYEKKGKDQDKNVSIGAAVFYKDAKENIIHNSNQSKKIVVQGLEKFIVVDKENVLFICPKKDEQSIKKLIEEVRDFFGKNKFDTL